MTGCALSSFGGAPIFAQTVPVELRECAGETDNVRRLACYDREMARISEQAQSAPKPAEPSAPQADQFGLPSQQHKQPASTRNLVAQVAQVFERKSGGLSIELDNGQVWQQAESTTGFYVKSGDRVTIAPGALGSFWMTTGSRPAARVRRVR